MQIVTRCTLKHRGKYLPPNDVIDVDDATANALIDQGLADKAAPSPAKPAGKKPGRKATPAPDDAPAA
jgi:hypothetical protein